ncbi:hypothetical protein AA103196_2008 [Ameyamaea chiangmaiensis NBRC 103196]|nr:hypothetical protein AA103196_2008 [Ameyamaea chiangmaiensis NBRC 103196]
MRCDVSRNGLHIVAIAALLLIATLSGCTDESDTRSSADVARLDGEYGQLETACHVRYPPHVGVFHDRANCLDKMMFLWARATGRDTVLVQELNFKRDRLASLIDAGGLSPNDSTLEFKRFEDEADKAARESPASGDHRSDGELRLMLGAKGLPSGD